MAADLTKRYFIHGQRAMLEKSSDIDLFVDRLVPGDLRFNQAEKVLLNQEITNDDGSGAQLEMVHRDGLQVRIDDQLYLLRLQLTPAIIRMLMLEVFEAAYERGLAQGRKDLMAEIRQAIDGVDAEATPTG
jgi:hypothetical protein